MARLPVPGSDDGTWGAILNDYLSQAHDSDGLLKSGSVGATQLAANSVTSAAVANGALPQAKIQNLTTDLAGKAPTVHTHAQGDITGLTASLSGLDTRLDALETPVITTLTDGVTVNTDASLGNHFRLTMAGDRILAAPTNPTDGQKAMWEVTASGADRTLTLAGGAGGFAFGTEISAVTATVQDTTDYIGAVYNTAADSWRVIAYVKGY